MHTNIFTWIRKRQFTLQLFIAVMVNMMVFSQPISYVLNNQNRINKIYFSGGSSAEKNRQSEAVANEESSSNSNIKSDKKVVSERLTLALKDANVIPAIEKQGIIGKSENLPIDELTDNIFSFELKEDFKKDKEAYLEYELFGLADGSQATKSINDQLATGGSIIKINKAWTRVRERINPLDIQKGKNFVKFTTSENADYQYMIRNLKMVYEDKKNSNSELIVFNQQEANSYKGKIAFSGFITDGNASRINVLGSEYDVINGVFEVLVEEKEPNTNLVVTYIDTKGIRKENSIKIKQLLEEPTQLYKNNKIVSVANKIFEKGINNTLAFAGATLKVEDLSVNETKNISITGLRYVDLPTLSPEMVNVTADYYGYRMLPHGVHFNLEKPAKIHLKYDEKKLPTGYTAKDIKTFYFDNEQRKWLALEKDTLLSTTQEIVSKTTHFTDFINGIIKVPESPETGSYTPTSIKDIKAADPTAGVVSIAPPSPNNMGTLNTSFPIKLPAGRSGMQPDLSVNYNSEGGNGWMGLGWDLSIPGVSLDTRWGAPRYGDIDGNGTFDNKETEIYSMGGGMLTFKDGADYTNPHRKDNINSESERKFYSRVEGSYAEIIRHGNNPTNYWWEVTDKMGNKSYFGGYAGTVVNNAVIRTGAVTSLTQDKTDGNIAYWALYRTEDTNGNYVEYVYDNNYGIDVNSGKPGTGGNEFYIKEIKYTLHSSSINNFYKVSFNRTNNYTVGSPATYTPRQDIQVNARNGVVQVTKDLLKEVKVSFEQSGTSQTIRTYRFNYETHTFVKSQLVKIAEYDVNGELFYANTFEYHNKDENGNLINESNFIDSSESNIWNHDSNNIDGNLLLGSLAAGISNEFSNEGSTLGSTKGWGINGGLYVGFGIPCSGSNLFTVGVNGGYSYSESKGLITFMDVNGDGLPDKIYKKDGAIKFRPNLGLPGSNLGFGSPQDISGIGELSETISDSKSVGVQASYGAFAGYTYNTSKSVTKTYFSDVNGDGLVDLVDKGNVKFNHALNSTYLNLASFSSNNSQTQNPIGSGSISTSITNNLTLETKDQLRDENPQHDIVKIWTAPKPGAISITGNNVILEPLPATSTNPYPTTIDQYYNDYDGVRISIQKNSSAFPNNTGTIIKEGTITPTFVGSATPNTTQVDMNYSSLSVAKGDRLYFRVQAKDEGTYDRVKWNPIITYTDESDVNADGLSYYSSSANEGFILSAKDVAIISQDGTILMEWNTALSSIAALTFSDNLTFTVEKGNIDTTTGVFNVTNTYYANINQSIPNSLTLSSFEDVFGNPIPLNVVANNGFRFSVTSNSNVDWKAIKWEPKIILTPSTSGNDINLYPVVNYGIYNKKINEVVSKITGLNNTSIIVRPVFDDTAFTTLDNGNYSINLVVKNSNKKVLASQNILVIVDSGNLLTPVIISGSNDIIVDNDITSTIYAEYFTDDINVANIGALVSEPIKVEIYQSNDISSVPPLSVPTGSCTTNWITSVNFNGTITTGNTCIPYYQQITTPAKSVVRNTPYNLGINLNGSARAAAWIDWNKNTIVELGEVYSLPTTTSTHNINITIPVTALEGEINVRLRGGSTLAYTVSNFNTNSVGSVRDFKINVVSLKDTKKDIYCKVGNNDFGPNYRNWGHFGYHGGIVIQRGIDYNGNGTFDTEQERRAVVLVGGNPVIIANYGIDSSNNIIPIAENALITDTSNPLSICDTYTGQALIDCLEANNTQSATSMRFINLIPNEEYDIWLGSSKEVSVGENHFSTSRMGIKNINTIYVELPTGGSVSTSNCDFPPINGISLINKGEGHSASIGGSVGGVGGSLNTSTSFNWAELNYMDLNGDRYPDILTKDNVQFTNSLGALSETRNLGFGRVSTGETSSYGAGASGSFTVATTPGTYLSLNIPLFGGGIIPIVIPITAPKVRASAGINANVGTGGNKEKLLWVDMNGDGLPDRINMDGGIKVSINLGYGFDSEKTWVNGTSELKGTQSNFSGGASYTYGDYAWGGGISISASKAFTESNLADINGDGLPDLILNNDSGNLSYRLNTGNGFDGNTYNNSGYISFNRSTAEGINAAFSIPIPIQLVLVCFQIIINPSVGGEQTLNRTENSLDDINGDGFLDILNGGNGSTDDGYLKARLSKIGKTNLLKKVNTPTGGSWEVNYERVGNTFEFSQSKYVVNKIKIFDAFTADNNWSNDRNITTIEYENPYHDRREREFFGFEKVRVNQHGGFNTDIDLNDATATLPEIYRYSVQEFHNKNYYLKGAVKKESLFDADNNVWTENKTTYGIYLPETILNTAATRPASFNDTNYALPIDIDTVTYGSGVTFTSSNLDFICTDLDVSRLFVTPLVSVKTFTEGQALGSNNKTAVTVMEGFDAKGNITQYRDYGEQGTDVYVTKINYYPSISGVDNSFGFPQYVRVYQSNGTTLQRERKAEYNSNGDLDKVITRLNITENATVRMQYDTYGNLSKVVHENSVNPADGSQFFREYTYDDVIYTYPIAVNDAFGYSSSSVYNYLFGIPVYTTDMNMQPMRTRIDDRGRPIEITGPYELFVEGVTGGSDIGWTIRFEYQNETPVAQKLANENATIDDDNYTKIYNANNSFQAINIGSTDPTNKLHHALTRHFDPEYRNADDSVLTANQILTSTLVDGFGKPVQVKKMFSRHIAVTAGNTPNTANNALEWLLAGKVKQDAFGRAIESYYPTTQTDNFTGLTSNVSFVPTNAFVYDNNADAIEPTTATYDVLDRSLTTKLPGETEQTTMEYVIESNRFVTTVTNELGQVQKSFTDVRGRTTQTLQESLTGAIPTNFEYNNIGELLKVIDVAGSETLSSYDLAGRRIELRHPDNGITQFVYDQASNLIERKTANLLQAGQKIEYKYTYNRLDEIKYPQNPENNVHYYYGTAGNSDAANDNAVGRLWYHVDATGTQYMKYGKLGELILNRRSVAVPGDRVYWFQTEWTYDTWNRVKTIKYPDQELVTYKYNKGGELHAMTSEKNGTSNKDIISQLGYDKFGQRTYLRYGNGTETTYDYQAERRRLDRMKVQSTTTYGAANNRQFVNNKYNYDVLSNVLSIQNNTVTVPTATQIGGRSWQEYTYDDLNRLTTASGNFVGRNDNGVGFNHSKYTLAMSYDSQHNITSKIQNHETATSTSSSSVAGAWTQVEQTSYNLNYQDYNTADYSVAGYSYTQPHAPRTIVDQPNLAGCCDAANDPRVKTKTFDYDANGNQTRVTQKICTSDTPDILRENLWDEENRLRAIDLNPEANTVHPIAIYTYDVGGERIIKQNATSVAIYENALPVGTAIKNDFMLYPSGMLVARPAADGTGALSYTKHYFAGTQRVSSKIGTTTNLGKFLQEWTLIENSSGGAPINLVSTSHDQLIVAETGVTHVYTQFGITPTPTFSSNTAFLPIANFTATGTETETFWFHPDHLGSSNYITNFVGEVSQHMEYFAFGETFIEEHKNSHNSPYKFNGKELDEESGYTYYGARYLDMRYSMWISVDPLANFNPFLDEEFYIEGSHNGGVYNSFNHNVYGYCYQNPINLVDPNGKQGLPGAILGVLTEYASIVGEKMLFDDMTFTEANKDLSWRDGANIAVAGGFGSFSGVAKFTKWASSSNGRKILVKLLELGIGALEDMLKQYIKDENIDLTKTLVSTLTDLGMGYLLKGTSLEKYIAKQDEVITKSEKKIADISSSGTGTAKGRAKKTRKEEAIITNAKKEKAFYEKFSKPIDKTSKAGTTTTLNGVIDQLNNKKEKKK